MRSKRENAAIIILVVFLVAILVVVFTVRKPINKEDNIVGDNNIVEVEDDEIEIDDELEEEEIDTEPKDEDIEIEDITNEEEENVSKDKDENIEETKTDKENENISKDDDKDIDDKDIDEKEDENDNENIDKIENISLEQFILKLNKNDSEETVMNIIKESGLKATEGLKGESSTYIYVTENEVDEANIQNGDYISLLFVHDQLYEMYMSEKDLGHGYTYNLISQMVSCSIHILNNEGEKQILFFDSNEQAINALQGYKNDVEENKQIDLVKNFTHEELNEATKNYSEIELFIMEIDFEDDIDAIIEKAEEINFEYTLSENIGYTYLDISYEGNNASSKVTIATEDGGSVRYINYYKYVYQEEETFRLSTSIYSHNASVEMVQMRGNKIQNPICVKTFSSKENCVNYVRAYAESI